MTESDVSRRLAATDTARQRARVTDRTGAKYCRDIDAMSRSKRPLGIRAFASACGGHTLCNHCLSMKRYLVATVVLVLIACTTTDRVDYSEDEQLAAIALLEGIYTSSDGALTVRVCETDDGWSPYETRFVVERDGGHTASACCYSGMELNNVVASTLVSITPIDGEPMVASSSVLLDGPETNESDLALPFASSGAFAITESDERHEVSFVIDANQVLQLKLDNQEFALDRTSDTDCVADPIALP